MSKTLLYRLFGIGGVPKNAQAQIRTEGVVLQDEGIGGSVTYKKYRAPGKYFGWRRNWFSGSIVLTQEHFLTFRYSKPIVGLALNDDKFKSLDISVENEKSLCVAFEASTFQEDSSGDIEVRLSTSLAPDFLRQLEPYLAQS